MNKCLQDLNDKPADRTHAWVVVKITVPFLGPYYNTAPNI